MQPGSSFRERLRQLPKKEPWGGSEDLWRYREAAAVLASFDYGTLQPSAVVSSSSSAKAELLADCEVAYNTEGTPIWSLRAPMRRAALRRLIAEKRIQTVLRCQSETVIESSSDIA